MPSSLMRKPTRTLATRPKFSRPSGDLFSKIPSRWAWHENSFGVLMPPQKKPRSRQTESSENFPASWRNSTRDNVMSHDACSSTVQRRPQGGAWPKAVFVFCSANTKRGREPHLCFRHLSKICHAQRLGLYSGLLTLGSPRSKAEHHVVTLIKR